MPSCGIFPSTLHLWFPTVLPDTWEGKREISCAPLATPPLTRYFPCPISLFYFFLPGVSLNISWSMQKKGQNSCLAALEMLQLVLKLMLFQHRFLLLCTWGTAGCQRVCMWSNTTSRACFPPEFELKMAQSFSYLHVPHGQLKCSY